MQERPIRAFVSGLGCLLLVLGLLGCQSGKAPQKDPLTPQPSFMESWRLYNHCMSTEDLESLIVDTLLLRQATNRMQQEEVLAIFAPMQPLMSPSPVRLSADPREMTAACMLRTADKAVAKGWKDLAVTLYESIMKQYPGQPYVYYRQQAGDGLIRILQHIANLPDTAATDRQGQAHP